MARNVLIKLRRDTAANWASVNPTPSAGEPCFENDTGLLKVGDGSTAYSQLLYINAYQETSVVGVEWNRGSTSPTLKRIDLDGNKVVLGASFFNDHVIWKNIGRCTVTASGEVTKGTNARGDGLDLTGASGNVMVEIPAFYVRSEHPSANVYRWWVSPHQLAGFELHPAFKQRGGQERSHIYGGAYLSVLRDNAGTLEQHSKTGEEPWTGGEIDSLVFTSGSVEFTVGETLTGATSGATGQVVDFHLTSGTWTVGDAAGVVYLKQVSAAAYQAEDLNGATAGVNCATASGANSALSLTIGEMESYANAIGTGWGETNIHTLSAVKLLMFTEWASLDSQASLGLGVVAMDAGSGFAGVETGADSVDTNVAENGTGKGTGANGFTPVSWRGFENPFGNVSIGVIGYNAVDAEYRIINRDGTGTPAAVLTAGNYEASAAIPTTGDGYISDIEYEDLLKYMFLAKSTAGGSASYIPDYQFSHDAGETNVLFAGGFWNHGYSAGAGQLSSADVPELSARSLGARLEFLPEN